MLATTAKIDRLLKPVPAEVVCMGLEYELCLKGWVIYLNINIHINTTYLSLSPVVYILFTINKLPPNVLLIRYAADSNIMILRVILWRKALVF